jgi:Ser/Thr protein kinase RdoA (MazF antagonist)
LNVYNLHEVLLTIHGGIKVNSNFRSVCDNNRIIVKVVEDMAKSSVDIDNFKKWMRNKDDNELFLIVGKFFLKQIF